MRKEKLARQEHFMEKADEWRAKYKKMSAAQKQQVHARRAAKAVEKNKLLQGNLIFPVRRMKRKLRTQICMAKKRGSNRAVTTEATIFSTAVLEYLVAEVLELAGECANQMKKKRIVPRHIMAAIKMDDELSTFMPKGATFSQAGVLPKAIPAFLAKNNVPKKEWKDNWGSNLMREQHIHGRKSANDTASDINNNNKKDV